MGAEQSQLEKLKDTDFQQNRITFFINGKEYNVQTDGCDPEIGPQYLLVDYLRDKIGLTGTKYMCRQGGCGACMVTVRAIHPVSGQKEVRSANSCLLPLFACDGLEITTVEGLGNKRTGYNPIQQRLVKFGGTQCGFCTPGFVMNMHSVIQDNPRFTTSDVEYSFDGNLCRCTGYRPIIEAFKSLSTNPSEELKLQCSDIEDAIVCPMKTLMAKENSMEVLNVPRNLYLGGTSGEQWFKVTSLPALFDVLERFTSSRTAYRLVAGNTGTGVFPGDGPYQGFIEINDVPELHYTSLDQMGLVLGGGVTITNAISTFDKASQMEGFVYAKEFYDHLRRVAALAVRNRGSIAGNLMLKHAHREFRSDVFLLFESVKATLRIGSSPTFYKDYTLLEFLELDMTGKVILSVHFPTYKGSYYFRSFKVSKRYQHAEAYVNGAFLFKIDPRTFTVLERPSICYGGITPDFVHANATEEFLEGQTLDGVTLKGALLRLKHEAVPNFMPGEASPEYRLGLAQSYLYKFILGVRGNSVGNRLKSGGEDIPRGNNKGKQIFDTDKSKWPLNQPVPKLESFPQTSGEAEYINDIRAELDELFGVFVVTTVANATIKFIDASQALMTPGVVAFVTAKDIPGNNNHAVFLTQQEEIFVESRVRYAGQPVGLLVATDKYTAFNARSKVIVTYDNVRKPVLDIRDSIRTRTKLNERKKEETNLAFPCRGINGQTAKDLRTNISSPQTTNEEVNGELITITGEFFTHAQYHFHMETQNCICIPTEDGMEVLSGTQHMDSVQATVAGCLGVPNNSVSVRVRRLGGAFGAKISKANHIAGACAVAAHVTNKPVRVQMDLGSNMHAIGKRLPYLFKYNLKVDSTGKIHQLDASVYCNPGSVANEPTSLYGALCFQSAYRANNWNLKPEVALTDTAPNTYCRSPGSAQGVAGIETVMEHIAYTLKKDPLEVRQVNFMKKGDPFVGVPGAKLPLDNLLPGMIAELKVNGEYDSRKQFVEVFNQNNRWKKRGISIVPQRYPNYYPDLRFPTLISVYHVDGTVNVSHGGIEMGQGINTKVAQVVAYTLQIPLEKVLVKPSTNLISPNATITGASVGSELVCSSARVACEQLLERLAPLRKQLGNPSWEQLIAAANGRELLLTSQYQHAQGELVSYDIIRCDVIKDCGQSISPLVDIGQIEGAVVMGFSWWLTEELIYDQNTGELLTTDTWQYKPMLPADIPEDLRVTMLRNAPNPFGVLSSKSTGESPFNMSVSVLFALRNAIDSVRREIGNYSWYQMDGPVTREVVRRLCLTSSEQFVV
ncbi:unnamed protein product [Orchesella dallaii]|uniref:Xanthine dehydrogenase n=1 Tax=Orchesella dallaii TaxID=48710 RepID=A0ABP1QRU3_9HEXA